MFARLVVVVLLVFRDLVHLQEAVEAQHRAAHAEIVGLAVFGRDRRDVRRGHVVDRRNHLRGHKALPDQRVELELLVAQIARNRLRRARGIGGPDGFVRVLRVLLALVDVGRRGQILRAQVLRDPLARRHLRFRRHARRIGTHISDQAGRALGAQVHAFIEPLRHAHGAAHVEAQLVGRIALQLAGDERRQRPALLLARLH